MKLHGAKSSVILSIFRASAQAITLKTLVSTKQHEEEGQTATRSASQYPPNGPVYRTSTETDDCTSFDTVLDYSRVASSPHITTQIAPLSTELHKQHELPVPSTLSPASSEQAPIVLRCAYTFAAAAVYC